MFHSRTSNSRSVHVATLIRDSLIRFTKKAAAMPHEIEGVRSRQRKRKPRGKL